MTDLSRRSDNNNEPELVEPAAATDASIEEMAEFRSLWSDVWRQFRRHKGAMVGAVILAVITFACVFGPGLLPFDLSTPDVPNRQQPPGWPHIWGTEALGRDVFGRALVAGRISLAVGFVAMIVSIVLGVLVGVLAGYVRWLDGPLMRLTDLFLSLPLLPVLLVIVVLFRNPVQDALGDVAGIFILMVLVIGGTSWMSAARIVRGDVLAIKEQEYIIGSRS